MLPGLVRLLATAPPPETRRAVGQMSVVLLAIALGTIVFLAAVLLIQIRRRNRLRQDIEDRKAQPAPIPDAWAESSRRLTLDDDTDIPREPGTE